MSRLTNVSATTKTVYETKLFQGRCENNGGTIHDWMENNS